MKARFNSHDILWYVILSITWLGFSSCSIHFEKRRYTRGYYLDVQYRAMDKEKSRISDNNVLAFNLLDDETGEGTDIELVQSANGLFSLARQDEGEPCDRIYFADGSQAEVKVLELNDKEVVYRRCNEPNAPVIILNKKHITKIEFSSGERYEEVKEEGQVQSNWQEEVQKTEESTNQPQNQTQKSGQALAKEGIVNIFALFFAITGLVMLILAFMHSWYWLFGAAIFSALGASMGWFGINMTWKGLGIVALIIGTVCSILSSVLFGFL